MTKVLPLDQLKHDADPSEGREAVLSSVRRSLAALGATQVAGLLTHRWEDWRRAQGGVADALSRLREEGVVERIGVSLSTPEELIQALGDGRVDYVQLPFNLLDRRWLEPEIQASIEARPDVVVAVRSVFLQGLLARPDEARWPAVGGTEEIRRSLSEALVISGCTSYAAMALSYVRAQPFVDCVVLGAETDWQVRDQAALFAVDPMRQRQVDEVNRVVPAGPSALVNPALWQH